jgi:hypothetical protein
MNAGSGHSHNRPYGKEPDFIGFSRSPPCALHLQLRVQLQIEHDARRTRHARGPAGPPILFFALLACGIPLPSYRPVV